MMYVMNRMMASFGVLEPAPKWLLIFEEVIGDLLYVEILVPSCKVSYCVKCVTQ